MNNFKDFGIANNKKGFTGPKIKIHNVLNLEITVHEFRIDTSKFEGRCLQLQIELDGVKRVLFTGSIGLMDDIEKVPANGFPFSTTIIRDMDFYKFT